MALSWMPKKLQTLFTSTATTSTSTPSASSPSNVIMSNNDLSNDKSVTTNGSSDTSEVEAPGHITVPDGGLRAWLVVFGGFLNFTVAFGLMNSFGAFQARYEARWPGLNTSTVTWIGSVQLFIFFLGGLAVGPAFDKFGARRLMFCGTFFCFMSFACTSLATKFPHFVLSQGVLFGIGNAMLYYPTTGAISEWFNYRRGFALGLAASGSSLGGVLWPMLLSKLFTLTTDRWVHRINGFISIPLLLLSCFLVKERRGMAGHDTEGNEIKQSKRSVSKAIFDWRFTGLCVGMFFIYGGMLIPFYYIPIFAVENGINLSMANNLLAIGYSGSMIGRIAAGWTADRMGRFNTLFLIAALTSFITFCWVFMTTLPGMVAFAFLFGLFSGGLIPLGSACVAQTSPDMGHIGLRIGFMMAVCSIGALGGGPLSGLIKESPLSWAGVKCFSATLTLIGAILLLGVRLAWERRLKISF